MTAALQLHGAHAAPPPPDGELHVEVEGLKSSRGDVIFALYNSKETFTKKAYKSAIRRIDHGRCEWTVKRLPRGDYAMVVVHDENGNRDMDMNVLGIPEEPYAFSNDAKGYLGAPNFDTAKFSVTQGLRVVRIHLE